MNESFNLLNKKDKAFIRRLVKNSDILDLNTAIEDYAYECLDLEEIEESDFEAWEYQLYSYAASIDPIK